MTEPEPPVCTVCGQTIAVDDGAFRKHVGTGAWANSTCPGTGTLADPDHPPEPNPVGPPLEPTGPPPDDEEPPPRV